MLYVNAKITANNGDNLAADAAVGPTNLFLHSLFSQVDISLNSSTLNIRSTLVTPSTNTYPYRAMMESLLSYGEDSKKSQLTSALFYKDTAGRMDSVDFADAAAVNEGLAKRRTFARQSWEFDMMGRLHADLFFQERFMLNEVVVKMKIIRSRDAFFLMAAGARMSILHASMLVRKVKLMPSVFLAHVKTLENGTAKYPIHRVVCKTFAVPQNYLDVTHEKLFSGQLPTRLVVGLVDNRPFNGNLERNPFNFQHYNLSEIALYLDGQQQFALKPIQPDYANGLCI